MFSSGNIATDKQHMSQQNHIKYTPIFVQLIGYRLGLSVLSFVLLNQSFCVLLSNCEILALFHVYPTFLEFANLLKRYGKIRAFKDFFLLLFAQNNLLMLFFCWRNQSRFIHLVCFSISQLRVVKFTLFFFLFLLAF